MDQQDLLPIAAGGLVVIPLDLTEAVRAQVTLVQASYNQDFALLAWISRYPDGPAIAPGYQTIYKTNGWPLMIYRGRQTLPDHVIAVPVSFATCVLNVRNRTNEADVLGYQVILA